MDRLTFEDIEIDIILTALYLCSNRLLFRIYRPIIEKIEQFQQDQENGDA